MKPWIQYFTTLIIFLALTCPFVPSSFASLSLSFHLFTRPRTVVNRIKTETGTSIIIPADDVKSDTIRIEGDPKGVAAARAMLLEMAAKMVKNCSLSSCYHRSGNFCVKGILSLDSSTM